MHTKLSTPIGYIWIYASGGYITGIYFSENEAAGRETRRDILCNENEYVIEQCKQQLNEYFIGERRAFDLKLKPEGTDFRKKVWQALLDIPFGETRSYKDVAERIGRPAAVRAVGGANHNNPISIVIPCHRVIGANGALTGYGGGLTAKEWLLNHETRATKS